MIDSVLECLAGALRESEILRTVIAVRTDGGADWALAGEPVRALRDAEIRMLEADGNVAEDWSRVRVSEWFRPGRVKRSQFLGDVVLGQFEESIGGPGGVQFSCGVFGSTIANSCVGHNSLVRNVGLLSNCAVGARVCLSDCGRIICNGTTAFGNGIAIPIGPQSGGRYFRGFAETTLELASALTSTRLQPQLTETYAELLARYRSAVECSKTIICVGASITHVPVVQNAFIGPG